MRTARFPMDPRYVLHPKDCAWMVDGSTYAKLLSLTEVATVNKFGPHATVLTGEIGKVDSVPVLVSAVIKLLRLSSENAAENNARADKQIAGLIEMPTTLLTPLVSRIDTLLQQLVDNPIEARQKTETVPNEGMTLIAPEFEKLSEVIPEIERNIITEIAEVTYLPGCLIKEKPCPTDEVSTIQGAVE